MVSQNALQRIATQDALEAEHTDNRVLLLSVYVKQLLFRKAQDRQLMTLHP